MASAYQLPHLQEKAHLSVKLVTLSASVGVSSTIPCFSKRFLYRAVARDVTNHVTTGSGVQLAVSCNGSLCGCGCSKRSAGAIKTCLFTEFQR